MSAHRQRIVLKFGTGILTKAESNSLDQAQLRRLAFEVAALCQEGYDCIVVSSGSVGAGMMELGLDERPKDLPTIQACAAVGQTKLMRHYETYFSKQGMNVAQLLLTHQDMDSKQRNRNARNTLERLFAHGNVVPIINENDTVAVEELRFSDNDKLSAEVARLADADLLILLTSVDGLMRTVDGVQELVPAVEDIDDALNLVHAGIGKHSVGGMATKLCAVREAVQAGIPSVIANGRTPGVIARIVAGEPEGTRFGEILKR